MSKRYVGSMEASWRIFQFPTVAVKPAITHLPIHLENQQRILYDPTNPVRAQQALENGKRTMLTEFFQANVEHLETRFVLYCNFPESFVYNTAQHCWTPRERQQNPPDSIGHLRTMHPSNEEDFVAVFEVSNNVELHCTQNFQENCNKGQFLPPTATASQDRM